MTPALWTCGVPTELSTAPLWIVSVAPPSTKTEELPEVKPVLSGEVRFNTPPDIVVVPLLTARNRIEPGLALVPPLRFSVLDKLLSFNPPAPVILPERLTAPLPAPWKVSVLVRTSDSSISCDDAPF